MDFSFFFWNLEFRVGVRGLKNLEQNEMNIETERNIFLCKKNKRREESNTTYSAMILSRHGNDAKVICHLIDSGIMWRCPNRKENTKIK